VFGFVCYSNVQDVDKLCKDINNVCFGQLMVYANVARFDRFVGNGAGGQQREEEVSVLGERENNVSKKGGKYMFNLAI